MGDLTTLVVFLAGLALIVYGIWLVSHSAALIVGGCFLVLAALAYERGGTRPPEAGGPA